MRDRQSSELDAGHGPPLPGRFTIEAVVDEGRDVNRVLVDAGFGIFFRHRALDDLEQMADGMVSLQRFGIVILLALPLVAVAAGTLLGEELLSAVEIACGVLRFIGRGRFVGRGRRSQTCENACQNRDRTATAEEHGSVTVHADGHSERLS